MAEEISGLQQNIESLIAKLPPLSSTLVGVDKSAFAGTYNISLSQEQILNVSITPYINKEKSTTITAVLRIPNQYKEYSGEYLSAFQAYLENTGLMKRGSPDAQVAIARLNEEGADQRIQSELEKISEKITIIPKSLLPLSAKAFNGEYSIVKRQKQGSSTSLTLDIAIYRDVSPSQLQKFSHAIPAADRDRADIYLSAVQQLLEKHYGLIAKSKILSKEAAEYKLQRILAQAASLYPLEFGTINTENPVTHGLFSTHLIFPTRQNANKDTNIILQISLRPFSDYINKDTSYLQTPAVFYLGLNTGSEIEAKTLQAQVDTALLASGFISFDLSNAERVSADTPKEIPKNWIDLADVISEETARGIQQIILVRKQERHPQITWSTGTRRDALAQQKLAIIRDELIPMYMPGGSKQSEPLTLAAITEYMNERCPEVDQRVGISKRTDIRLITANNVHKLRLLTPSIDQAHGSYYCRLRFSPPSSVYNSRQLDQPLNTSDFSFAQDQARRLQTLTEIILTQYFIQHPDMSLITHTEGDEKNLQSVFTIQAPGEPIRPNQVFLRSLLDEQVEPALADFNRYIFWQPEIKKLADDRYEITCQVRRNETSEAMPNDVSPFQGPFSFYAKDEPTAKAFAQRLDDEMIREQYLYSRERPVDSFGQTSMGVAIRESLRTALQEIPAIEAPDTHVFQTLTGRRKE